MKLGDKELGQGRSASGEVSASERLRYVRYITLLNTTSPTCEGEEPSGRGDA